MQGHLYTQDANENSNDGGDEASFSIGSGVASWSNSNKRTAERKVRLLRCFTNSIPWVYVGHSGSVCISSTCGGYYKNKIFRTASWQGKRNQVQFTYLVFIQSYELFHPGSSAATGTVPKWTNSKWQGQDLVRLHRFCPLITMVGFRSLPSRPSWWTSWIYQPPELRRILPMISCDVTLCCHFFATKKCAKYEIHK